MVRVPGGDGGSRTLPETQAPRLGFEGVEANCPASQCLGSSGANPLAFLGSDASIRDAFAMGDEILTREILRCLSDLG